MAGLGFVPDGPEEPQSPWHTWAGAATPQQLPKDREWCSVYLCVSDGHNSTDVLFNKHFLHEMR